jgi:hypothetical protein
VSFTQTSRLVALVTLAGLAACGSPSEPRAEPLHNVTSEGVEVVTTVTPSTIMRGDTATITATLTNTRDTAVTLSLNDACSIRIDLRSGDGTSVFYGDGFFICADPRLVTLTIPAHGTERRTAFFTGFLQVGNDYYSCVDTGDYDAVSLLFGPTTADGRAVQSNKARVTLRDVARNPSCAKLEPGRVPPCTGAVTITASAGLTPTFTWTPACRVSEFEVMDRRTGQVVWSVRSWWTGIAPGLRYGAAPSGSEVRVAPTPLVAGGAYIVTTILVHESFADINGRFSFDR